EMYSENKKRNKQLGIAISNIRPSAFLLKLPTAGSALAYILLKVGNRALAMGEVAAAIPRRNLSAVESTPAAEAPPTTPTAALRS
ncbi:hypothetical protein, partial [Pseudomonas aeruginosa]|uniref:hypothetical protein n=1 Tax=Pseudomonas aeruginosa TaxID=287 RepID=UPI0031B78CA0